MTLRASRSRSRLYAACALPLALTAGLAAAERPQSNEVGATPAVAGRVQSELHVVSISVDVATGEFTYSRNPVYAKRGDRIQWTSEQGAWSVTFQQTTPFDAKSARARKGVPQQLTVRPDATNGSYKYTVGLVVEGDVFTDDPEVIIRP